jgi:hypothetical protein
MILYDNRTVITPWAGDGEGSAAVNKLAAMM